MTAVEHALSKGTAAPEFAGMTDGGGKISLAELKGHKVVLYFYPKDDTPGCTTQACDFRDSYALFQAAGARIIGVSRDSVTRHDRFKAKHELPFPLISDEDGRICEAYGVWVEKKNYGRTYMGIERSTFLIDEAGIIQDVWRKVRVKEHVAKVLAETQA